MKKALIGILVLALIGLGAWKYGSKPATINKTDKPVVKIGVILPLTGSYSTYGEAGKKSLQMFEEDLKKRKLKNEYQFIVEASDANDIKTCVNAARKVVLADKADAVISIWNSAGVATTDIVKGKNIIHMNLGNDARTTIEKHNFNFGPSGDGQVNISLSEMKNLGTNKLAVIGVNNA